MKKVLLVISIIVAYNLSSVQAQTERGKLAFGVSSTFGLMGTGNDFMTLGVSSIKYKSDASGYEEPDADRLSSFNLLPKVGVFVANNFLIGLDISLAYSKNEDNYYDNTYTRNLLSAGPYLRYYIPTSKVKPFIEATSSFGRINTKYEDDMYTDESKQKLSAFGGGFGVAIPVGSSATFDLMAHYTSFTTKNAENNIDNERMTVGTLGLKLGFVVFLGN